MNLHKLLLTKNACYIAGGRMKPQGIMVHSTGANNPTCAAMWVLMMACWVSISTGITGTHMHRVVRRSVYTLSSAN